MKNHKPVKDEHLEQLHQVNDLDCGLSPLVALQLHSPHASIMVRLLIMDEPVDKCIRKGLSTIMK